MSFLNNFSAYRSFNRVFIKKRNTFLDKIYSVESMTALAKTELSAAYANFHSNIDNYVACLYMSHVVKLKGAEFAEEMDYFSKSRHSKFQDDIEKLQNRIAKVMTSTADVISKKIELRKIINKSIRMRKFYAY